MKEESKKCPKCGREVTMSAANEFYWICMWCIEGWTTEELNGIRRYIEWRKAKEK